MNESEREVVLGLINANSALQILTVELLAALEEAAEGNAARLGARLAERITALSPTERASELGVTLERFQRACAVIAAP